MIAEALRQYFEMNCKPSAASREGQKLGAEYETFILIPTHKGTCNQGYMPLPMSGVAGIPGILENLTREKTWIKFLGGCSGNSNG